MMTKLLDSLNFIALAPYFFNDLELTSMGFFFPGFGCLAAINKVFEKEGLDRGKFKGNAKSRNRRL